MVCFRDHAARRPETTLWCTHEPRSRSVSSGWSPSPADRRFAARLTTAARGHIVRALRLPENGTTAAPDSGQLSRRGMSGQFSGRPVRAQADAHFCWASEVIDGIADHAVRPALEGVLRLGRALGPGAQRFVGATGRPAGARWRPGGPARSAARSGGRSPRCGRGAPPRSRCRSPHVSGSCRPCGGARGA